MPLALLSGWDFAMALRIERIGNYACGAEVELLTAWFGSC